MFIACVPKNKGGGGGKQRVTLGSPGPQQVSRVAQGVLHERPELRVSFSVEGRRN